MAVNSSGLMVEPYRSTLALDQETHKLHKEANARLDRTQPRPRGETVFPVEGDKYLSLPDDPTKPFKNSDHTEKQLTSREVLALKSILKKLLNQNPQAIDAPIDIPGAIKLACMEMQSDAQEKRAQAEKYHQLAIAA